jgi:hypothetical protein
MSRVTIVDDLQLHVERPEIAGSVRTVKGRAAHHRTARDRRKATHFRRSNTWLAVCLLMKLTGRSRVREHGMANDQSCRSPKLPPINDRNQRGVIARWPAS